jgi:2-oxoacid:acceptor oxidoreductase delta subunit (pyruvate/2-ketoisovalerate family)
VKKLSFKPHKPVELKNAEEMPFCTMSLADMTWNKTGSWRYLRPQYVEQIPACQSGCPTANNIEAWIGLFGKGKIEEAWNTAAIENPFPGIMGRVCYHPCQEKCNRKELGGAVSIQMLERALADEAAKKDLVPEPFCPPTKKKIAVVGSGPAGLACAYHLTRLGHRVTVIERSQRAGGMLRHGIPEYRLPKDVLDREIERLKKMGIEFQLGRQIRDAAQMQLLRQEYDAVFLAIGAHKSKTLGIPDERAEGVIAGLAFLDAVSQGKAPFPGARTVVVGGGNTAIDAARTALRLKSSVTVLYRRSRPEMPAFEDEIREAEKEGIKIEFLVLPKRILLKEGKAGGIICERAKLGEPDDSGRRQPVPIPNSECQFEADTIICAIGEDIETAIIPSALPITKGAIATKQGGRTAWSNVFAGGDFIGQTRTVVESLASGKRSAIAIDCLFRKMDFEDVFEKIRVGDTSSVRMADYLNIIKRGKKEEEECEVIPKRKIVSYDQLNCAYFWESNPNAYPAKSVEERLAHRPFTEILLSPPKETTADELSRCFHCGRCIQCDNCFIYCPDISISKEEMGYKIDLNYCKGCGVCVSECPRAAMEMIEEPVEII